MNRGPVKAGGEFVARRSRADQDGAMASNDIRQRLLDSTGIDFALYQHEEMVEALDVTSSILRSIKRAVIWSLAGSALVVLVLWLTVRADGGWVAGLVLAVIGIVSIGALAISIWVWTLGGHLKTQMGDVFRIAEASAGQMHEDLTHSDPPPTDRQLAEGLLLVTVTPALGAAVRRRVWVVGRPLAALSERMVSGLLSRATAQLDDGIGSGVAFGKVAHRLSSVIELVRGFSEPAFERFRRWVVRPVAAGLLLIAVLAGFAFIALAVAFA